MTWPQDGPGKLVEHIMRHRVLYYIAFITTVSLALQVALVWAK